MNNQRIIIKPILPIEALRTMVSPLEWCRAEKFSSASRRKEWLSWRAHLRDALLREPFGGVSEDFEIGYTPHGAPYIIGSEVYISVSHTRTHVAILLSTAPCAIDMELLARNFSRVAERYISPAESMIINTPELQAIAWSTKEAAYKYSSPVSCDLLRDIIIEEVCTAERVVKLTLRGSAVTAQYSVAEGYVVVIIPYKFD